MATHNHVKLLDMDEHDRDARVHTRFVQDLMPLLKKYDLVLDLATSDVVAFIEDTHGGSICIE